MTSAIVPESMNSFMNFAMQSNTKPDDAQDAFNKVMQGMTKDLMDTKSDSAVSAEARNSVNKNERGSMNDQYEHRSQLKKTEASSDVKSKETHTDSVKKADNTSVKNETKTRESVKSDIKAEDAVESEENTNDTAMSMIDLLMQMFTEVTEILDTDVRDVTEVMNDLGLTTVDLLDPEKMQELMLNITGGDEASLIMDEGLYNQFKQLSDLVNETKDSMLEIAQASSDTIANIDDVMKLIRDQLDAMQGATGADDANLVDPIFSELDAQAQNDSQLTLKGAQGVNESIVANDKFSDTHMSSVNGTEADGTAVNDAELISAGRNGNDLSGESDEKASDSENGFADSRMQGSKYSEKTDYTTDSYAKPVFADTMQQNIDEVPLEALKEGAESMTSNTEEIMKQIVDYMRSARNGEMTEVEMQLHPSELGTLHISVASKNGLVTAQFTAQDEQVRAAIEASLDTLKENLNQAGVKIEAVEVTVSSHAFERNLEQESRQEQQKDEQAADSRKSLRRINLDFGADVEGEEELDEAETIARDMMMRHGNSLDYMA
ncbi:MAG: flagellar hook-length control protein FliK [Lachnospiraceae bacterium]|nr:flagellar hook-length control protein FliK [Candidatus Merdinaster equi]